MSRWNETVLLLKPFGPSGKSFEPKTSGNKTDSYVCSTVTDRRMRKMNLRMKRRTMDLRSRKLRTKVPFTPRGFRVRNTVNTKFLASNSELLLAENLFPLTLSQPRDPAWRSVRTAMQ